MGNNPSKSGSGGAPSPAQSPSVQRVQHRDKDQRQFRSGGSSVAAHFPEQPASPIATRSTTQRSSTRPIPHRFPPSGKAPEQILSRRTDYGQIEEPRKFASQDSTPRPYRPIAVGISQPVKVPSSDRPVPEPLSVFEPSAPPSGQYYAASSSHKYRPPRLPLPIEEELHTPGSPIITPADLDSALDYDDVEEIGDDVYQLDSDSPSTTVPTLVEWKQGGERVYVTGTFAGWNKKFRLFKDSNYQNVMSATLQLPPGTHHLKFIVDGEMRTSDDLPTAVDYTNILVNYIEVTPESASRFLASQVVPPGIFPPQVLPDPTPQEPSQDDTENAAIEEEDQSPKNFDVVIPQFLFDAEEEEDSSKYEHAAIVISEMPAAPSLPLFLTKPVLNGNTPMKDDNSVLNYPNHTVINHLATSSIKNGVLATSGTTRYKRKYVTTIIYKPTGD